MTFTAKDRKYLRWTTAGAFIFSTCSKANYMAVIVTDGRVVATGYNGGPSGWKHCEDGGCPRANTTTVGGSYSNCIAIHAEANAFLHSNQTDYGPGSTIYVNGLPCLDCAKLIVGSGITRLVCLAGRDPVDRFEIEDFLSRGGVEVIEAVP